MNDTQPSEIHPACPWCGYDLAGLPPEYTCPECGFDYDPAARVIDYPVKRQAIKRSVLYVAGVVFFSGLAIRSGSWMIWFLACPYAVTGIVVLSALLRRPGCSYRLILNRSGMRFEHYAIPEHLTPWVEVGEARYNWMTGRLTIRDAGGQVLHSIPYRMFGRPRVGRVSQAAINACREWYLEQA